MRAMEGLSKADTLRLAEIEHYAETGKRPDGMQVTDAWVDESMKFLVEEFRPMHDAWVGIKGDEDLLIDVDIAAGKLYRLWRRGVRGEALDAAFENLGKFIARKAAAEKAAREAEDDEE